MKVSLIGLSLVLAASTAGAAEQTLTAAVGDSHCGKSAHPTEFRGKKISGRDCIVGSEDGVVPGCLAHGAKYILVAGDKVYQVSNQDFAGLRSHAAQIVRVTGEVVGDTIAITRITPERAK